MNSTGRLLRKRFTQKGFGIVCPKALSGQWQMLRQINIEPRIDPLEPIMSVTNTTLSIRGNSHTFRNIFLLPITLAFCVLSYMWLDDKSDSWSVAEQNRIHSIEASKRLFGEDFFNITDDPDEHRRYNYIGDDGKMSFEEYIDFRLTGTVTGLEGIIFDVLFSLFVFGSTLGLILWLIIFRRRAEIYFDRQRRMVYTWRFGLILATRFENLGIIENVQGLQLLFCGENAQDDHGWRRILIQPTSQPMFNRVADNQYPLAVILQFMEQGKETIITGDRFRRRPSPCFFTDLPPPNFEPRLEQLLTHLDNTEGYLSDEVISSINNSRGE